ncbi:DUF454 domain-containing protein [Alginatibacterium sediminis]|uniref:Inner membrane protein n=1 Tax=Alginatibacterium sediminis TaxID=2164068 RepID=A0A420EHA2_9ALTE|nr:YbaN family protein [Alginatibacterium sediminis]RKF20092.1 DUF454 domain-containing protein [Alginatibacterium sediminis]
MKRLMALVSAYFFLGLALVGVILPGLPTVPFLLLSAWFAAKSSPALHQWLYSHPRFGALLRDWEREGAISRRSKVIAVLMLSLSWLVLWLTTNSSGVLIGLACLFVVIASYLVTRPDPSQ